MYLKGFDYIVLSLAPGLALGFCWVLEVSSRLQGGYKGVAIIPCLGMQSYKFPIEPLAMALCCALSSCFGNGGAAFWRYGSLGVLFSGTGYQGVPRLVASGGGVVDDVLWWKLGMRVAMASHCVFYRRFRLAVKCCSTASGTGRV